MAILRSRAVPAETCTIAAPGVERAIHDWEQKITQSRQAGAAEVEARLARRAAELEVKAKGLDQELEKRVAQAKAALEAEFRTSLAALAKGAAALAELETRMVKASEHQLVALALELAARILHREIANDPTWMEGLLAAVLRRLPERRKLEMRMHPQDAVTVREVLPRHQAEAGIESMSVLDDPGLKRGDVVLRSGGTEIDAGLAGAWQRLSQEILAMAPPNPAELPLTGPSPK